MPMIPKSVKTQDYKGSKTIKLTWREVRGLSNHTFNKTVHLGQAITRIHLLPSIFDAEVNTGLNFSLGVAYFLAFEKKKCSMLRTT